VDWDRTHEINGIKVAFCSKACMVEFSSAPAAAQMERMFGNKGFAKAFRVGIKCPVSGNPAKADVTYPYKNGRLFFCSEAGPEAFMSDVAGNYAPKANHQLVATGQAIQVRCPMTGQPVKSGLKLNVSGVIVKFCSEKCLAEAEKTAERDRVHLLFNDGAFEKGFRMKSDVRLAGNK
jgi:YHS domain-containing protein